jgi:ABC-type multidrug transport system ATPase subunit
MIFGPKYFDTMITVMLTSHQKDEIAEMAAERDMTLLGFMRMIANGCAKQRRTKLAKERAQQEAERAARQLAEIEAAQELTNIRIQHEAVKTKFELELARELGKFRSNL